jgi:hypothetical protein
LILTPKVVEKVCEEWAEWRANRATQQALHPDDFCRVFGNKYEGTRIKDTKWIVNEIKKFEAELNPKPATKSKKSNSKKRARELSSELNEAPVATTSGPVSDSHAQSEGLIGKRPKQSLASVKAHIEKDASNEDAPETLASITNIPAPSDAASDNQATASSTASTTPTHPSAASTDQPAAIFSTETPTKPSSIKPSPLLKKTSTIRRPAQNGKASSKSTETAQYITVGELIEMREMDENARRI